MSLCKISVVIAVFNAADTLQRCIDSISSQLYSNIQVIIIDGGPTDGSVDILKKNSSKIDFWVSEVDTGIYSAWNKALTRLNGDWVIFLGADDFFIANNTLLDLSIKLSCISKETLLAYTQIKLFTRDGREILTVGDDWSISKSQFLSGKCLPHQGVFHRSDFFKKHGSFDESYKIAGDYEMLLRELKLRDPVFIPQIISVGMTQGGVSSRRENSLLTLREIRRAQIESNFHYTSFFWLRAVIKVYIRDALWRVLGENLAKIFLDAYRILRGRGAYWTKIK